MSEKYYIGQNVSSIDTSDALTPYKKLTMIVGDDTDSEGNTYQLVYQAIVDPHDANVVREPNAEYSNAVAYYKDDIVKAYDAVSEKWKRYKYLSPYSESTKGIPVTNTHYWEQTEASEYDSIEGRELVTNNPWATQPIAIDVLSGLKDFSYKPYSAKDAFVPVSAELGDVLTINRCYAMLVKQDITFDDLFTSDISAPGADETENEFGLTKTSVEKSISLLNQRANRLTTKFTVEAGKIETSIAEETGRATDAETRISTSLSTQITQTATEIKSTVASNEVKYVIPNNVQIDYYGYGDPNLIYGQSSTYYGKRYLDQSTGCYYRCLYEYFETEDTSPQSGKTYYVKNGTSYSRFTGSTFASGVTYYERRYKWVIQNENKPFELITTQLESSITQTATAIKSTVAHYSHSYDLTNTYVETDDASPQSGHAYYTKNDDVYTKFTGSTFESGVTYYEKLSAVVNYYGYGAPNVNTYQPIVDDKKKWYFNDANGGYYHGEIDTQTSNAKWVYKGAVTLITTDLKSSITQTAGNINLAVQGSYAPDWNSSTAYYKGDIVKVAGTNSWAFYKYIKEYNSQVYGIPVTNTTYWESITTPDSVQSMIDIDLSGITIGTYSGGSDANTAYIKLSKGDVEIKGSVQMQNVTVDSITANKVTVNGNALDGFFDLTDNVTTIDGGQIKANSIEATSLKASTITAGSLTGDTIELNYSGGTAGSFSLTNSGVDIIANGYRDITLTPGTGRTLNLNGQTIYLNSNNRIYVGSATIENQNGSDIYIGDNLKPESDNTQNCGTSKTKWACVWTYEIVQQNASSESSDRRLKKDISYGLSSFDQFFDKLNPCTFRFIDGHERKHFGLIAQDVEDSMIACGLTSMDLATLVKEFNETKNDYDYYLRYGELIPLLIWEVQELKKKVKELTA